MTNSSQKTKKHVSEENKWTKYLEKNKYYFSSVILFSFYLGHHKVFSKYVYYLILKL